MARMSPPPCGIYRTTVRIAGVEPGQLVYFHNHGDPGAGIYLPQRWHLNRAQFSEQGHTLEALAEADTLAPLPAEGLYRVRSAFVCCEKKCRTFSEETLLQLGYNGAGRAIVFEPEWRTDGLGFPERGQMIDDAAFASLVPLIVQRPPPPVSTRPEHFH